MVPHAIHHLGIELEVGNGLEGCVSNLGLYFVLFAIAKEVLRPALGQYDMGTAGMNLITTVAGQVEHMCGLHLNGCQLWKKRNQVIHELTVLVVKLRVDATLCGVEAACRNVLASFRNTTMQPAIIAQQLY